MQHLFEVYSYKHSSDPWWGTLFFFSHIDLFGSRHGVHGKSG